jgi:hypothetical protein
MYQSEVDIQGAAAEYSLGLGLWYDADRLVLEGLYLDEITAYRARKRWIQTLETNFLLEGLHDFRIRVRAVPEAGRYRVRCDFLSACGRYAFWRLTHHQAPEVQYMLETAHLPTVTMAPGFADLPETDELLEGGSFILNTPPVSSRQPSHGPLPRARRLVSRVVALLRNFAGR